MITYVRRLLQNQYAAAFFMLRRGVEACPDDHWEEKIANGSIRWMVYHTLFCADLYLWPSGKKFVLRDFHKLGGDERTTKLSRGLERKPTLDYLDLLDAYVPQSLKLESPKSLAGPSGIAWYPTTRGDLHIANIRHIQHHAAQLHAYLRREKIVKGRNKALRWAGSGRPE